jgi:hypothetical protein
MAKGNTCPQCKYYMLAVEEKEEPEGTWVIYECLNNRCKFRQKIFESKWLLDLYLNKSSDDSLKISENQS